MSWSVLLPALLLSVPITGAPHGDARDVRGALAVLHGWDASRSAAYVAGEVERLRALYAPSSTAAATDVRMLRAYAGHDWRVTAMATQVRSVRVLQRSKGRWALRVTDRVRGLVDTPERCRPLPADPYRTHDLTLVRSRSGWIVARVRPAPSPGSR